MANIGIFVGTVYGNAQLIAEEAVPVLSEIGHNAIIFDEPTWQNWETVGLDIHLIITSTTGQGDLPDNIRNLYAYIESKGGYQPMLRYAIVALGDSSYTDFCQAGKMFDAMLQSQHAQRIVDVLLIDGCEVTDPERIALPWLQQALSCLSPKV